MGVGANWTLEKGTFEERKLSFHFLGNFSWILTTISTLTKENRFSVKCGAVWTGEQRAVCVGDGRRAENVVARDIFRAAKNARRMCSVRNSPNRISIQLKVNCNHHLSMDWDDEYDLLAAGGDIAGPSFVDRARNAPPDEDDADVPMPTIAPAAPFAPPAEDETPLQQLIRHWINERNSPDILPAQEDLLVAVLDHIRRQSQTVQLLREDASTSEDEHIRIVLAQTEMERVKFIVRSYVRTRHYKIDKYARFIATNAEIQTRLTAGERDHAVRYADILDRHLYKCVLQSLPPAQAHLDDNAAFVPSMITTPDKSRPVFVHALQRCPRIRLPDGTALEMEKGHITLVPYHVVEQLVARGEVELV
ncbi:DNA replication complex GINS protein sld5 [Hypsizygus marmoreus]|uniref:DNA replication complex GINS protein SLD5 n=1 Tax=Hypsizygus marmoreus TaxID=39966 RepID=A0A369JR02_HYPMA|nr:DNA replication complex GINS protein sld5 [Hypsizygus marmoreus]